MDFSFIRPSLTVLSGKILVTFLDLANCEDTYAAPMCLDGFELRHQYDEDES